MKGIFKFWCYDIAGTAAYPSSVEVEVTAFSEELALKAVKKLIKRDTYRLLSVKIL